MTSRYASTAFWLDTLDRCVSTIAQAAIGVLTAGVAGILEVDPVQLLSVAGLAGAVSVLTSVAFRGRGDTPEQAADKVLATHGLLTADEQEADVNAATARVALRRDKR